MDGEPLVVVVFGEPKVGSVPDVSGGEVHSRATSSASNGESVLSRLSRDGLDLPLLSARLVIMSPEVNVDLSASSTDREELSVALSVVLDDVVSIDLSSDWNHLPLSREALSVLLGSDEVLSVVALVLIPSKHGSLVSLSK